MSGEDLRKQRAHLLINTDLLGRANVKDRSWLFKSIHDRYSKSGGNRQAEASIIGICMV